MQMISTQLSVTIMYTRPAPSVMHFSAFIVVALYECSTEEFFTELHHNYLMISCTMITSCLHHNHGVVDCYCVSSNVSDDIIIT